MNGDINERELEILKFWDKEKIFEKTLLENKKSDSYTFYDGPPFATGLPHHGHLLQSFLKDSIPRYQTMKGKYVRRVWGWDTHGLPLENLVEQELGLKNKKDIEELGVDKFTKVATDLVLKFEGDWKKIIPRIGRWVDMENSYMTLTPDYTESCWWAFSQLYKKNLAYEGYKVMHICPRCETPLAASEVALNYVDVKDISVYVKFELSDEPETFLLAWTTTPWTLPGNTAIAINQEIKYAKVEYNGEKLILAKDLVEKVLGGNESSEVKIVEEFLGSELVGKKYKPVFDYFNNEQEFVKMKNNFGENISENIYKVWHADFVTADAGTGIAHEAPAFGEDDYNLAVFHNIPTIIHLGMDGRFFDIVSDFKGERVKWKGETQATDKKVCEFLQSKGRILKTEIITHSYPLCWRCDTPLLNYATNSWFIAVYKMRDRLVEENKNIYWIPENVREGRMGTWLANARDWAVSRNRYWGAPLPVWKSVPTLDKGGLGGVELFIPESLCELQTRTKSNNKYTFIRHGETDANKEGDLGVINVSKENQKSINDTGIKQAELAGQELSAREDKIDIIISSPYKRAIETANILAEELGINKEEIITSDLIQEFQIGTENEGKLWSQLYAENKHVNILYQKMTGADETKMDVANRMSKFVNECEQKYVGKNILIVTHKSPIACAEIFNTGVLYSKSTNNVPTFRNVANCEIVNLDWYPLPTDETGKVNFHLPHIDNLKVYDESGNIMKREGGVFDCWFESGSMPYAQFHYPFENQSLFKENFPAEFIAEAQDQTRGWFYTMLVLGVGIFDQSPYKSVITSGMINAGDGKKMAKKLKNYTDPLELIEKFGSDAMRFYILSSPVVKGESIKFTDLGISSVYSKNIGRLLNVVSLYKMNAGASIGDSVMSSATSEHVMDKYIISRLKQVKQEVTNGFETLKIDEAFRPIEKFIDDLSVWYVRRSRNRFKSENLDEKKQALQTCKYVLENFAKVLAPIMPFTAEMIWQEIKDESLELSVHLSLWGELFEVEFSDIKNVESMEIARSIVSQILDERIKAKIKVRQPLSSVQIPDSLTETLLPEYLEEIKDETNIKEIIFAKTEKVELNTEINEELKMEGMYRELVRLIQDKRKEENLKAGQLVKIILPNTMSVEEKEVIEKMKTELMKETNLTEITFGESLQIIN